MRRGKQMTNKGLSKNRIEQGLAGCGFVSELFVFEELDSTNSYVKKLADEGVPEGAVVVAGRQSKGRGRLGRSFYSPEDTGIYMSILLRPEIDLQQSVRITSMAAVAVAEAIETVSKVHAGIKWVNDIYLDGKKVCGILVEAGIDAQEQKLNSAVLGIGINVGEMDFPEELSGIATSVSNVCGFEIERENLIAEVIRSLEKWYPTILDGSFLKESKRRSILLGKEIRVHNYDGSCYEARAVDLDDMGHLLIEKDGKKEYLDSGEVSVRV
jgi:BirA family biotin operon repressor/biotin-[acetyl-CoA-carboxylase] ligase